MLHNSQIDNHNWFNVLGAIFLVEGPSLEPQNGMGLDCKQCDLCSNAHDYTTPSQQAQRGVLSKSPPTLTSSSSLIVVDTMILSKIHAITSYAITVHAICVIHPIVAYHLSPPSLGLIMASPPPPLAGLLKYICSNITF